MMFFKGMIGALAGIGATQLVFFALGLIGGILGIGTLVMTFATSLVGVITYYALIVVITLLVIKVIK